MNGHKFIAGAALCAAAGLWIGGAFAATGAARAGKSPDQLSPLIVNETAEHFFVMTTDRIELQTDGKPNEFADYDAFRFPKEVDLSERGVERYVDALAGENLTHLFVNVNFQRAFFPAKAIEPIWTSLDEPDRQQQPFIRSMNEAYARGLDVYAVMIRRSRERGVSPWLSFRMNDIHATKTKTSPMVSTFWKEHPEWHIGNDAGWENGLDYAQKPVRDRMAGLIREALDRYDADGIELDFIRFPHYFRKGTERTNAPILTVWSKEGLLDMAIACNMYGSIEYEYHVADWRKVLTDKTQFITGTDNGIVENHRRRNLRLGEYRAWMDKVRRDGADGVYFFNFPIRPYCDETWRGVLGSTACERAIDVAWHRLFDRFWSPKTGLLYEHLPDETPGAVERFLPTPAEIAKAEPIPTGWNTGMEDGVLNGCPLLLAAMLRKDTVAIEKLLPGLLRCATVSGVPGFLARSISPADGKSVYPDSSRDQYTLFVYTMWRFSQNPLCTSARREEIRKILVDIARRTETCMDAAHNYTLVRLDGKPGLVSKMWMANPKGELYVTPPGHRYFSGHAGVGGVWSHEANRLPMIYAAAYALTGDAHWRTRELEVADDALRIAEGGVSKDLQGFALHQMQVSLRLLWECETDPTRKNRYRTLMEKVASHGALCLDRTERLWSELKGNLSAPAGDWRTWPKKDLGPSSGLSCLQPTRPEKFLKAYHCVRELGESMIIQRLCPGRELPSADRHRYCELLGKMDFTHCMSPGLVYPILADAMLTSRELSLRGLEDSAGRECLVNIWPQPAEMARSTDYAVSVDGRPVDVLQTRVTVRQSARDELHAHGRLCQRDACRIRMRVGVLSDARVRRR